MHVSNDYYGHDWILRLWSGVREEKRLFCYTQHGWNPTCPFESKGKFLNVAPFVVWSEHNRAATQAAFPRARVIACGSPFVYLAKMLDSHHVPPTRDLLVFPTHGRSGKAQDIESHRKLRDHVDAMEKQNVTVCLHPFDYNNDTIRAIYESITGVTVMTNWGRGGYTVRHDPLLLIRLYWLILGHKRVLSDLLSSALIYAGFLDRNPCLHMHQSPSGPPVSGRGLPLHQAFIEATQSQRADICRSELGARYMMEPDALRDVLGLSSNIKTLAAKTVRTLAWLRTNF